MKFENKDFYVDRFPHFLINLKDQEFEVVNQDEAQLSLLLKKKYKELEEWENIITFNYVDDKEDFLKINLLINKYNIILDFYDKENDHYKYGCTLKEFIDDNNYDDLDLDVSKIINAKNGDIVVVDHEHYVKKG